MIKKTVYILLFVIFLIAMVIQFFSPTSINSQGEFKVYKTININKPITTVYEYMGNSENAKIWSVYVDHIDLLSGEDGKVGCKRRCFKDSSEKGIQWDEEILEIIPNKKRVLSIYNGKHFPVYSEHLITEQLYTGDDNNCELSLILTLKGNQSFWENFKFKFASFVVKNVFKNNLNNIKKDLEKR